MPHHTVHVDFDHLPGGVTAGGAERVEDVVLDLPGNAEQGEAMIAEVASVGRAADWARHGGADDPRWLTFPQAWR